MRLGQRAEPALELLALGPAGAAEGLRRDRLQDGQRVLDAMIELLDQQIVQHLAARDRGRHPHRKGKPDQQQDAADQAGDREVAPQRADQRALRDAGRDRPAGQRAIAYRLVISGTPSSDTVDRVASGRPEHRSIQRRRGALADRLLPDWARARN